MKISSLLKKLPVFTIVCALGVTASPAFSKDNGKANGKGKPKAEKTDKTEKKGKHGRDIGELPHGLQQHVTKKGELPNGLQKKKDEDGQLTRGLEQGGKDAKPTGNTTRTTTK
jgi:hypothetical protein